MQEMTQIEKCWLVTLYSDGYRYLGRDYDNHLFAYDKKPEWDDENNIWDVENEDFRQMGIPNNLFQFVQCGNRGGLFKITCNAIYLENIDLVGCK